MTDLPPPGPELAAKNLRLIAERLNWPDGALAECELIQADHPGWYVGWTHGGGMTHPHPGYIATHHAWHYFDPGPQWVYAATPDRLRAEIEAYPVRPRGLSDYRPLNLPSSASEQSAPVPTQETD